MSAQGAVEIEAGTPGDEIADKGYGEPRAARPRSSWAFHAWGAGAYLVALAVVLVSTLRSTGGRLVYALDDPAIHLSVAHNLAHHDTWGVVPGQFESASSSPLWTLLLAGWARVMPWPENLAPLVLNVAASLAIVAMLALPARQVMRPSLRRPLDALAIGLLVVVVLFLPGLTIVGMEHPLHAALVLGAVILVQRTMDDGGGRTRRVTAALPLLLIALATLTRFETVFVAAGIGIALMMAKLPRRLAVGVGMASGLPLVGFALVNRVLGQGYLPNSVLAKTSLADDGSGLGIREIAARFTDDPYVALLAAVLLVALLLTWQSRSVAWSGWAFAAVVYLVAVALHVWLARIGWYERYQAYLIVLGVYALLGLLADVVRQLPPPRAGLSDRRRVFAPAVLAVSTLFAAGKFFHTLDTSKAATETYRQRYQAAIFLERYYHGQPVATGELGYISLLHHGPVTDLFGLGDYEVLQERLRTGQHPSAEYWSELADRRHFDVVAAYPTTLFFDTPEAWILVGTWEIAAPVVSAWEPTFQFWATNAAAVVPLTDHLREFEQDLPEGVRFEINPSAGLQALAQTSPPAEDQPVGQATLP